MKETKLVCPKCGAEFAIPEHEALAMGIVIGKDSGLGVIHPVVVGQHKQQNTDNNTKPNTKTKMTKAEQKIEALKAAGVNTSNLFSMRGADGGDMVVRLEDGKLSQIADDDPVFKAIEDAGTVPNSKLFRRWVMAQVFHMLDDCNSRHPWTPSNFIEALQAKGYSYQWRMMTEEFRVQAKLYNNDMENFKERNRWFDKEVAFSCAVDYLDKLVYHTSTLKTRKCKGVKYIHLQHKDVFLSDFKTKVYEPLEAASRQIMVAETPYELYVVVQRFWKKVKNTWYEYDLKICESFKDAYKGAGAFYTMKNLILFHGCRILDKDTNKVLSRDDSMLKLEQAASNPDTQGWWLFGMMRGLVRDNGIDIAQKIAEWRKR